MFVAVGGLVPKQTNLKSQIACARRDTACLAVDPMGEKAKLCIVLFLIELKLPLGIDNPNRGLFSETKGPVILV